MTTALVVILLFVAAAAAFIVYLKWKTRALERFARAQIAPVGTFVQIGANRIHYLDTGNPDGTPLVFVHGLGGNLLNFVDTLFPRLETEFRIIALDRAGSAFSQRPDDAPGTLPDHADVIVGVLDHLGVKNATIVGHSLGGAVALQTAVSHPDRVNALALIAPLTHAVEKISPALKALLIPSKRRRRFMADTVAVPMSAKRREQTLAFIFGPQDPPEDFGTTNGGLIAFFPDHFYACSGDVAALVDHLPPLQDRYDDIDVPVGILYGTRDRVLNYREQGERFKQRFPQTDLVLLEGIGHMPYFPEPDAVAGFVRSMAEKGKTAPPQPTIESTS